MPDKGKSLAVEDVELIEHETFVLTTDNLMDFFYFLDARLFNSEKIKPSLKAIREHFSSKSQAYYSVTSCLKNTFHRRRSDPNVKVAYEQWSRFLSFAYDKFDSHEDIFITHTYLSIFSKLLTYEILTQDDYIDETELRGIIDGTIFEKLHILNFTENDFFHWINDEEITKELVEALRAITSEFDLFDFSSIDEDILKGVYQDLIDRDTRHTLGEYYTPDWLCELVINKLDIEPTSKILDPSCGSGSFLSCYPKNIRNRA